MLTSANGYTGSPPGFRAAWFAAGQGFPEEEPIGRNSGPESAGQPSPVSSRAITANAGPDSPPPCGAAFSGFISLPSPGGLRRHISRVSFGRYVLSPHSVRFFPENERTVRFIAKTKNSRRQVRPGLPRPWFLPLFRVRAGEAPDELPDRLRVPDTADRSAATHLKTPLSGSSATLSGETPSAPSRACLSSS